MGGSSASSTTGSIDAIFDLYLSKRPAAADSLHAHHDRHGRGGHGRGGLGGLGRRPQQVDAEALCRSRGFADCHPTRTPSARSAARCRRRWPRKSRNWTAWRRPVPDWSIFRPIEEFGTEPVGIQGWPAGNYMFRELKIVDGENLSDQDPGSKGVVVGSNLANVKSLKVGQTLTISDDEVSHRRHLRELAKILKTAWSSCSWTMPKRSSARQA